MTLHLYFAINNLQGHMFILKHLQNEGRKFTLLHRHVNNINIIHTIIYGCCLVTKSCPILWRHHGLQPTRLLCPWDFFFRQEYWSGLPLPSPGDLPDPEVIRIWVFPPLFKKFHKLMAVQPEKKNLFLVYTMQSTAKVLIDIKIHSLILKTIYSFFPNKSSESVSLSVLSNFL